MNARICLSACEYAAPLPSTTSGRSRGGQQGDRAVHRLGRGQLARRRIDHPPQRRASGSGIDDLAEDRCRDVEVDTAGAPDTAVRIARAMPRPMSSTRFTR